MNGPRPVVLVVDDDDAVRDCLALILEDSYHVLSAPSGAEALATLREHPVDAMVLDVRMRGMDGIEVLRRLRATETVIPVVLLTAVESVETVVAAMRLGAVDYLTKPMDEARLLAILAKAIGRTPAGHRPDDGVVVWHTDGDLGRRATMAALLGTIAGVEIAPCGVPVIDGGPDFKAVRRQLSATHPRIATALERFSALTTHVTELVAPSYRSMTVDQLSDALGCSRRHLSRRFGEDTHVTLRDYLGRVRTEAAKCLLLETTLAVEVVGEEAGFYDASHFARVFRHYTGTSPGLYRQQRGMSQKYRSASDPYIV